MLETKEQKRYLVVIVGLILVLGLVSFFNRSHFRYKDTVDYVNLQSESQKQQEAYNKYLASINVDPKASQQLLKEVLPEAEIQAEVEKAFKVNQKVAYPVISDSKIKIANETGRDAVGSYMESAGTYFDQLKLINSSIQDDIFDPKGDLSKVDRAFTESSGLLEQYFKLPVPKDAVVFHKAELVNLQTYVDLLKISRAYMADSAANPWPETYKDYVIIDKNTKEAKSQYESLDTKYNITGYFQERGLPVAKGNFFIPAAQAQFAVIDIWAKAQEIFNEILATAVARFSLAFLDTLAQKLEATYRISNFLYYTDALVSGQYVDDYLDKYVKDSIDKTMIKNFIPQIACGSQQDLKPIFKTKADQYLGFDPESVNPSDPDYYLKMSRVGDFLSSPNGWSIYYQGVASEAQAAAKQAADNEMNSPGTKASRDAFGSIIQPAEESIGALRGIFQRYLEEGSADSGFTKTEKITSQISQAFMSKFLFKGAVLKEQKACISVPQIQPVVAPGTSVMPETPDEEDIYEQECAKYPGACLPRGSDAPFEAEVEVME